MEKIVRLLLVLVFLVFVLLGFQAFTVLLHKAADVGIKSTTIQLAAVDDKDRGVLIPMKVEMKPGDGKILMNIDNPTFISDTQESMRTAVREASRVTGYVVDNVDLIFSLKTNISIVGGPSAGAAMTAAVVSTLTDKPLRSDTVLTGTIEEGGYIGHVGGIVEKAQAAKASGFTKFIVPKGQAVVIEPVENCSENQGQGWKQKQCTISEKEINVSEYVGIQVVEAYRIEDVLSQILA